MRVEYGVFVDSPGSVERTRNGISCTIVMFGRNLTRSEINGKGFLKSQLIYAGDARDRKLRWLIFRWLRSEREFNRRILLDTVVSPEVCISRKK